MYIPLVELYSDVVASLPPLEDYLVSCHKHPVLLNKETAGFVHARLQACLMREMIALYKSGVCTAEQLDDIITFGFGRRYNQIGPMMNADFVGADLRIVAGR